MLTVVAYSTSGALSSSSSSSQYTIGDSLPNSCIGLSDGDHWLQPSVSDESYMPVYLTCNNEYMIIDIAKDDDLINYFSSFEMFHYQLGGPANHNPVNWQEWFLGEESNNYNENSEYLISPDCSSCDSDYIGNVHDIETTYWMTGNLAKLTWPVIGFNDCDMDYDTYDCYNCQSCLEINRGCSPTLYNDSTTNFKYSGICGVTKQQAGQDVYTSREIAQVKANYKPSIGTAGKFCVCYKPDNEYSTLFSLTEEQEKHIEAKMEHLEDDNNNINWESPDPKEITKKETSRISTNAKAPSDHAFTKDLTKVNYKYLSQSDFNQGTYRITESGTYIINEDIIFDFNSNDDYWPRSDQSDEYPGANSYRDPYHLGFFAGIAVECDNVIIDLNGYTLEQSLPFYYQQRWFAIIELGNQQFLPGQGPSFFGPDPVVISNIEIKNGVLGRTSHFAIHGNFPSEIKLYDLRIKDFVTHGLQLNGWNNLDMNNIEVGPSSTIEYLKGDYGHGRILLQRLERIAENADTKLLDSVNDYDTLLDIKDELELQMDLAYSYAMNRNENKYASTDYINPENLETIEDKLRWKSAKAQFVHESGYPSSSSITGIFLNFQGASVFSYEMYTTKQSENGKLNNIYIHDIYHDMVESMRFGKYLEAKQLYPTPWNSDIPAEHAVGGKDMLYEWYKIINNVDYNMSSISDRLTYMSENDMFSYKGSILTDVYFTLAQISDDWDELGFLEVQDISDEDNTRTDVIDWVNGEYSGDIIQWQFGCNQDIMGHSGKGLLGFRMDGVNNVELSNIKISNLYEHTELGSDACGEYLMFKPDGNGGHFKQSLPMQYGFSGNDLQAMSIISSTNVEFKNNIFIENLQNDYSQSFGLSFWTANDITFDETSFIKVSNIISGIKLEDWENENNKVLDYSSLPNRAPESCGVRLEISTQADYYESSINFDTGSTDGVTNIITCDITAREKCLGDDDNSYTMYGNYFTDSTVCNNINSLDDLNALLNNQDNSDSSSGSSSSAAATVIKHRFNDNKNNKYNNNNGINSLVDTSVSSSSSSNGNKNKNNNNNNNNNSNSNRGNETLEEANKYHLSVGVLLFMIGIGICILISNRKCKEYNNNNKKLDMIDGNNNSDYHRTDSKEYSLIGNNLMDDCENSENENSNSDSDGNDVNNGFEAIKDPQTNIIQGIVYGAV